MVVVGIAEMFALHYLYNVLYYGFTILNSKIILPYCFTVAEIMLLNIVFQINLLGTFVQILVY